MKEADSCTEPVLSVYSLSWTLEVALCTCDLNLEIVACVSITLWFTPSKPGLFSPKSLNSPFLSFQTQLQRLLNGIPHAVQDTCRLGKTQGWPWWWGGQWSIGEWVLMLDFTPHSSRCSTVLKNWAPACFHYVQDRLFIHLHAPYNTFKGKPVDLQEADIL